MTTANKITLTRIAMIPFFIYFAAQPMLIIDETRYLAAFPTSTVIALVLFCVHRSRIFWTAMWRESTIR